MSRAARTLLSTTALVALALGATGCGANAISTGELEEQITTQLTAEVGQEPDAVDCPDALDAEVGATTTCVLTDGDVELDVAVEVTAVEDDTARFSIEVADPAS